MLVSIDLWTKFQEELEHRGGRSDADLLMVLQRTLRDLPEVSTITYDPKSPPSAEFPFRLSLNEERNVAFIERINNFVGGVQVKEFAAIIRRAQATLAAPKVEALSEGEELVLAYVEKYDAPKDAHVNELVKAMRIRFPKPEKTPEELANQMSIYEKGSPPYIAARDELVRRASRP